jgi:hypothetical protein
VVRFSPRPLYPWGKSLRYPYHRRPGGPQNPTGHCKKRKEKSCLYRNSKPKLCVVQPGVVAIPTALSLVGLRKITKGYSQCSQCSGRDSNQVPAEQKRELCLFSQRAEWIWSSLSAATDTHFVIFSVEEPCVVCMYAEIKSGEFCLPGCNSPQKSFVRSI